MVSVGLVEVIDLREALEELLGDLPQLLPLALQQFLLLDGLPRKFHLQDGVDDLRQQLLREDAGEPHHQDLIQQCITYVVYLRTLVLYVELLPAKGVGHEIVHAGEVVGV